MDSAEQKQQIGAGQLIFEFLSKRHLPTGAMASNGSSNRARPPPNQQFCAGIASRRRLLSIHRDSENRGEVFAAS